MTKSLKNKVYMKQAVKKLMVLGVALAALLSACSSGQNEQDNVDKLLDRQAKIQEEQEQSVDQLENLKDSLVNEKKSLLDQRDTKDQQIQQMEENQDVLTEKLKEEEANEVFAQRAEMEAQIKVYKDSIAQMKSEVEILNVSLDSIENNLELYNVQEVRTDQSLESGIAEIDERMTNRENRKQQEIKRIELLRKRVQVAEKKKEAYELEKELYVGELNALLRNNATEKELAPFEQQIHEMDSIIAIETNHKNSLVEEIRQAEKFVNETENLMKELRAQIKEEYERKEIIETFIDSEKERLSQELEQIQNTRRALLEEQEDVSENLTKTEMQISRLNKDLELIKNKEMSDILQMQADIEKSEANLAQEEINLLEDSPALVSTKAPLDADSANEELYTIFSMGNQLDSLNELIQVEKTEIAKTRMELSEKRAEAAEKRAKFGRAVGVVAIVLILGGIALLALFYYLGRRSRKS